MIKGHGDRERSCREVAGLFNAEFRVGQPSISSTTVSRTMKRYRDTGSVKDQPRSGRPKTTTSDEVALDVLQTIVETPITPARQISRDLDIPHPSVLRILKQNKFHPYKVHLVQELSEDDFDRRLEYCETVMRKVDEDPDFIQNIVFSDEATFMLNGNVNRHNCRILE